MIALVGEGFTEGQVLSMPIDKIFLYSEGVKRKNAYSRQEGFADLVSAIGVAFSGKGFKEYLKEIEGKDG